VDETKNSLPQQFVAKAFCNFEPNAVVLATEWDYFISPSLYCQFIRNERRDVTVIDKSLLQNRSWYFLQCEKNAPWLMDRIRLSTYQFLAELDKFEHDLPFDVRFIQSRWQDLLTRIVEESLPDHPVYIDPRIDQEFPLQYQRTPAGLFLRLTKTEDTTCYRSAITSFTACNKVRPAEKDLENYYIGMLFRDADWLIRHGRSGEAKKVVNEVLRFEPGNSAAIWLMNRIEKM
jgi:hypothetical protein